MKLNLGCGRDIRPGYTNVDIRPANGVDVVADLSNTPWSWRDGEVEEVMMLDFLEHFPYRKTDDILMEVWRILKPDGVLVVQVPDFAHCARAAMVLPPFMCNRCPTVFDENVRGVCHNCGQLVKDIADEAIKRLYGGQDYPGNWHFTAFTQSGLEDRLMTAGFNNIEPLEKNENGETFYQNWNLRLRAHKSEIGWD